MNICFGNYLKLFIKCYDRFSDRFSCERNTENNAMPNLYFNEESNYPEEKTCGNEVYYSNILYHRKKLNIHASAADLLHA